MSLLVWAAEPVFSQLARR